MNAQGFFITEDIRKRAYELAERLWTFGKEYGLDGLEYGNDPNMSSIDKNAQGFIGELVVEAHYPWLCRSKDQRHELIGIQYNPHAADFTAGSYHLEVKTNRFPRAYDNYLINVTRLARKDCDYFICGTIESYPRAARVFTLLGCISRADVVRCPVWTEGIYSPGYSVPVGMINTPLEDFYRFKRF